MMGKTIEQLVNECVLAGYPKCMLAKLSKLELVKYIEFLQEENVRLMDMAIELQLRELDKNDNRR